MWFRRLEETSGNETKEQLPRYSVLATVVSAISPDYRRADAGATSARNRAAGEGILVQGKPKHHRESELTRPLGDGGNLGRADTWVMYAEVTGPSSTLGRR